MRTFTLLEEHSIPYFLSSFSSLDCYFKIADPRIVYLYTRCSLIDLAKIIPNLEYPGTPQADAACTESQDGLNLRLYFGCEEGNRFPEKNELPALDMYYDIKRKTYCDPHEVYRTIREDALISRSDRIRSVTDLQNSAILISRYHFALNGEIEIQPDLGVPAGIESQRNLLISILTGGNPQRGLNLLRDSGYIKMYWPEIASMYDVSHSKEFHPEGDVWEHTLETFRHRKNNDLLISLALFLHDSGKPQAQTEGSNKFSHHAELGERAARTFLQRLRFPDPLISDVLYLVRYHMLPGLLKSLPVYRTEKLMSSALFPELLEVYRCDLSSTFRGPDNYYEACKIYKRFLKHKKNPYRHSDGTKHGKPKMPAYNLS
jgi:poly(A) polymerase